MPIVILVLSSRITAYTDFISEYITAPGVERMTINIYTGGLLADSKEQ